MPRRVLFLQTARDQSRSFEDAAMRLGVQLVPFAGDAVAPAVAFAKAQDIDACVAVDGRSAVAAAAGAKRGADGFTYATAASSEEVELALRG